MRIENITLFTVKYMLLISIGYQHETLKYYSTLRWQQADPLVGIYSYLTVRVKSAYRKPFKKTKRFPLAIRGTTSRALPRRRDLHT